MTVHLHVRFERGAPLLAKPRTKTVSSIHQLRPIESCPPLLDETLEDTLSVGHSFRRLLA